MKVRAVNIGKRVSVPWKNSTVETGIFKYPVTSPIYLEKEQVKHDSVVDTKVHGGIEKAVYAFGYNHYAHYQSSFPNLDWQYGMFGENITLDHLDETTVNIGDVYQLGTSKLEVTQPRQPCFKLGIRFKDQSVLTTMWNSTKTGVYFKVVAQGIVAIDDSLICLSKNLNGPSVAAVFLAKRRKK